MIYSVNQREHIMSLAEAAERLGIQHDTLRRQIRLGKLRARKVGPVWTVSEREVERYRRDSLKVVAPPQQPLRG